jgi:multidrug efflux pump subunit AcrB/ABC-type multidrug transport system ATPase subunit
MLEFVIKRRIFVSMFFIGLSMLGYISYTNLELEMLPSVELPFLIVQVFGANESDPEYMEKQVIMPLEGAIGTLEGIDEIESFVDQQQGRILIYYNPDINLKYAYLKLQEKVDAVKSTIPDEFFITVLKIDTEQLSNMFMNLQIRGNGGVDRLRIFFENELRDEFESIDGIANVEVFGGREKAVEIVLDPELSSAYDLTPSRIRSIIARNNQEKLYLARLDNQQKKVYVNLVADFRDISDLENIVIRPVPPILLKDVADISFSVKDESSISRVNGKDAVTVQLVRDTRANLIELSHLTREVIEQLNKKLVSQDIEIVIQQDSAEYLESNLDLITDLALTGGLIAVVILWFFLRNIRLVMVIALALPISIFSSFNLFYAFDITLNSLTLVGMALAVGMLLDNSVVVLENIYRVYQHKKNAQDAVLTGTREIWRSIFAATLTTITVFLPFIFAENFMIRIIGYQIGVSIISTLVVSLVVALMLIPMLVYYFLERDKNFKNRFQVVTLRNRMVQVYLLFLKSAMRFPLRTIISALVIFFISVIIALAVSLATIETKQSDDFNLYLTMPGGSTLESTDLSVAELEERLQGIAEVEDIISQVYEEEAIVTLMLKDDYQDIENKSLEEIKENIDERIDEHETGDVSFDEPESSMRFGRGGGRDMAGSFEKLLGIGSEEESIIIKGRDFEVMRRVADDIQYQLEQLSSIDRVRQNVNSNRPEIHLLFEKNLLHQYEISMASMATELSNFQNEVSTGLKFRQGTEEYDILIRNEDEETEKDYEDLRALPIPSNTGAFYPLEQVSRIVFSEGKGGINRINQERQVNISYQFLEEIAESKRFLEASRSEVDQLIATIEIPTGVAVETVLNETEYSDYYFLIAVAALLIYMILAAVFESLLNPFIIMFTIPLAAIGSLWAIIFTESTLINANTFIGFLILLGIVVNNGIILIDYTRVLRQNGYRRSRALIVSGKARLRPIIITALTTIAAMFPLAMGKVDYVTTIAAPFAITVIGGLSLSTLFTLVMIPTVYSGLENIVNWIKSLKPWIQILQGILFVAGALLIYFQIDSLLWQFANLFLLLFVIPGLTYFIRESLRRAKEEFDKEQPITITIRNLYKIYDQPARFIREWRKGQKLSEKTVHSKTMRIIQFTWQFLLWLFLFYFIYIYLKSGFWIFILAHPFYFYSLYQIKKRIPEVKIVNTKGKWKFIKKIRNKIYPLFFWGFPILNLIYFFFQDFAIATLLLIAFLWYFALMVHVGSLKIAEKKVHIPRLKGIRKRFYQLIQMTPVIGKKTVPFHALNGVSLSIEKGMFGLLGPNGAGKTTLMRLICGILEQSYGTIHFNDINVTEKREELQGLIGYLPQEFGTYENMTANEYLNYQAILRSITEPEEREDRIQYVIAAVHMEEHLDEKIGSYSGGMKQRIGIAQMLLHLPRILVVDEPTAGLDPRERIRFRNLLVELSRDRIVVFSTHIIEDIASSCDRVAVLNQGKIRYLGAPVKMTDYAQGHVWQCEIKENDFQHLQKRFKIVHHIKLDQDLRIRILSEKQPLPDAKSVAPTLEDAYLWLLGDFAIATG